MFAKFDEKGAVELLKNQEKREKLMRSGNYQLMQ